MAAMEANKTAAEQTLLKARAKLEEGGDEEAMRLVEKSIRLFPTNEANTLFLHLRKFGAGSVAAAAVAVVAHTQHRALAVADRGSRPSCDARAPATPANWSLSAA